MRLCIRLYIATLIEQNKAADKHSETPLKVAWEATNQRVQTFVAMAKWQLERLVVDEVYC